MSLPTPSFNLVRNFLGISFEDTSSGLPTSWSWDFGDTTFSTERNPAHTYPAPGTYTVIFTATNTEGSESLTFNVDVVSQPEYGYTISEIIATERPSVILQNIDYETQRIKYWQLHLQILITPNISDAFVFDETKWPTMVNVLIAYLVIHDLIMKAAKESIASSLQVNTGVESAAGGVKSIETGPSKVEWYDVSNTISQVFKSGGVGTKSIFEQLNESICTIASRYRIKLPMCKALSSTIIVPQKVGRKTPPDINSILKSYGWGTL
jgi:PKD repeat protein